MPSAFLLRKIGYGGTGERGRPPAQPQANARKAYEPCDKVNLVALTTVDVTHWLTLGLQGESGHAPEDPRPGKFRVILP